MRKGTSNLMVIVLTLIGLWVHNTTQAQETLLLWKNGDSLSGKLMDSSKSGTIRWQSPYFVDDLNVDISALDSIVFSKQPAPIRGTFRGGTISGDLWTADIIDSDNDTFLFSNNRYGQFRVNREMIYSLENREHSNLIFDGSQLVSWSLPEAGTSPNGAGWHPEQGGKPHTDRSKTSIYYPIKWPKRYEIDFEVASTSSPPGFVFALGKNLYQALRIETWAKELVVVQGTLYEPILQIKPDHRSYRLRIAYDQDTQVLKVFDENGNLLLKLDEVSQTTNAPGAYVYNRGQNLSVQRLRIYSQPEEFKNQAVDFTKPRVHMMNGEVFHGKLFVKKNNAYILNADGTRTDTDIKQVDRVVMPGRKLKEADQHMALTYIDGSTVNGKVLQMHTNSVSMQTNFANEPMTCSLDGVSELRLETKTKIKQPTGAYDKMFFPTGILRGHITFDTDEKANIQWLPTGASEPVRIANNLSPRIERNNKHVSRRNQFDMETFPHLMHLKNGEVIPCQIISYDTGRANFVSPFVKATHIDAKQIKGIEFSRGKTHSRKENRNPITITGGNKHRIILEDGRILEGKMHRTPTGNLEIKIDTGNPNDKIKFVFSGGNVMDNDGLALKKAVDLIFDPLETEDTSIDIKLERALTVPRFNRDNPPKHILVAKNGDMKRGNFISFDGKTIQFDSNLKTQHIPIDRVTRIVDITVADTEQSINDEAPMEHQEPDSQQSETTQSLVRFALIHNPILIFEPIAAKDGWLLGRSPIYGDVSIPIKSIQYIHFGDKAKSFKSIFEKWVARSAKEPDFGADR